MNRWLFGYGSLIWRPDIEFKERRPARLQGWRRRFWQGSHDHRGVPERPGRVVTLIPDEAGHCDGMAYLVDAEIVEATFSALDHREKNGYQRHGVRLEFRDVSGSADSPLTTDTTDTTEGLVYIAPIDNHAYLGPAPFDDMVRQIHASVGPSGRNVDYLMELAHALRALDADDPHVFELEAALKRLETKI